MCCDGVGGWGVMICNTMQDECLDSRRHVAICLPHHHSPFGMKSANDDKTWDGIYFFFFVGMKNILEPNLFKYYSSKKRLRMLLIFGLVVYIHIFQYITDALIHCKAGLADHDNYHAFCRLLGRFKINYQVSQMFLLVLSVSRIIFMPVSVNCRLIFFSKLF